MNSEEEIKCPVDEKFEKAEKELESAIGLWEQNGGKHLEESGQSLMLTLKRSM